MLAWFVISRHHLHRTVPRPTSSLPPTAPFPLSPFPATLPKNLPVSLIIATLPKSLSVTPVFATLPRPPGGKYLTSQPAHPLPCIPSPYPTFLLFPFFSHSCALFCTHQNLNTFVFNDFRTLCKKPTGGEGSLLETKPSLPHHTHEPIGRRK